MEEYPRTLGEFEARFSSDAACQEYLFFLRWPEGFRCPRCGHGRAWPTGTGRFECAACAYQASVTAGTIFQDTHLPLTTWFRVIWSVTSHKTGASALGMQQELGLRSYKTAWTCLHKLRRAMVRPGRDQLSGRVEVDEAFLGGLEEGHRGRGQPTKAQIIVAAEEDGAGIGRVRMCRIPNATAESLHLFITVNILPGSVVHTDGWNGYSGIEAKGYTHEVTIRGKRKEAASELMPRVHLVISLFKRWLLGTHQGAISHDYLDYYLDEFTFRFNRRKSQHRGKLFRRLLENAVQIEPAPYKDIVRHKNRANHNRLGLPESSK